MCLHGLRLNGCLLKCRALKENINNGDISIMNRSCVLARSKICVPHQKRIIWGCLLKERLKGLARGAIRCLVRAGLYAFT